MYQLHKTNNGYILTQPQAGHITIPNRDELLTLRALLDNAIRETAPKPPISTTQAREIAQAQGHNIPATTLISACANGTIPSARKIGGRWHIQEDDFQEWLERWAEKTS